MENHEGRGGCSALFHSIAIARRLFEFYFLYDSLLYFMGKGSNFKCRFFFFFFRPIYLCFKVNLVKKIRFYNTDCFF